MISSIHKKVIFHLLLWAIWMYLSLSNAPDEDYNSRAILIGSLLISTHIPFYLFNTEWLIPRILLKKGVSRYMLYLLGTIILLFLIHEQVFKYVAQELDWVNMPKRTGKSYKGLIALIFVAAISTGYQLLEYFSEQEKEKTEKQKERLQSELSFLRSQISPHFIFNILNSIVYLIRTKSDAAETVTLKLSELIRYMLYESETDRIALSKEVSYLSNYIELQKIRFESDVKIEFDINGEIPNHVIEPMLMIPFVENAFKHGIGMVNDPAIYVTLDCDAHAITYNVKNKIGVSITEVKDESSGIGLKNVKRRLELLYPDSHKLTLSEEGEWFQIILKLELK